MTTESDYTIRLATINDAAAVFQLCIDLHNENALFPIDENKYQRRIAEILATDDEWAIISGGEPKNRYGFIALAEKNGRATGAIVLNIEKLRYTEAECLSELFNYVVPEHRRSDCAKRLIEFSKDISDNMGLPLLIGVLSTTRTEAKVRLYRRQLDLVGAFFIHSPRE